MPAGVTDFGGGAWLGALFGVDPPITTYYIALVSQEPGPDSDGAIIADLEPADTAYARQAYASGASNWAVNGSYIANTNEIPFPLPTVDWGRVSHYVLCTAASGGDIYAFGEFATAQYVDTSYGLSIPPGGLVLQLTVVESSIAV